jgi:hypothetical protein
MAASVALRMPSQNSGRRPSRLTIPETVTSRRTRSGCRIATCIATFAPLLKPMRSARGIPRNARSAAVSSAEPSKVKGPSSSSDRPWPFWSKAITRRVRARRGRTRTQEVSMAGSPPWRSTRGVPPAGPWTS